MLALSDFQGDTIQSGAFAAPDGDVGEFEERGSI